MDLSTVHNGVHKLKRKKRVMVRIDAGTNGESVIEYS